MTVTDDTGVMSLEQRLRCLEDINEIQRLKSEYTLACDDNYNPDAICELFTDDGLWSMNVFGHYEGKEAIRGFFTSVSKQIVWSLHAATTPSIGVSSDGTTAVGTWYLLAPCTVARDDGSGQKDAVVVTGNYQDKFRKVDGRWYFTEITARIHQISNLDEGWVRQPFR
ncbi:MAG TPA: nuclear transport factor 2 family protein [Pseudonocardia sp.]|jgi:hypothetical protein|nr:nuclear transport factor 2 family protein [Pseudonocardia sp.]